MIARIFKHIFLGKDKQVFNASCNIKWSILNNLIWFEIRQKIFHGTNRWKGMNLKTDQVLYVVLKVQQY